ncbi:MAG: hypothetical protein GY832_21765, partial [Chloroflexi bacterium]|nr:hypothetical protein [Chloroflexota bacterium]
MNRTKLRQKLVKRFNLEELRTLCYDLNVDFESLGGEGKANKARELVLYMERHDRMDELIVVVTSPLIDDSLTPGPPPQPTTPTYSPVYIRISDAAPEEDEYPVELTVPGERPFPRRTFQLD